MTQRYAAGHESGVELGLDYEVGFYTGCGPPQKGENFWGLDIDFGTLGLQLNANSLRNWSFALTIGPGTPGITFNPGDSNVSF